MKTRKIVRTMSRAILFLAMSMVLTHCEHDRPVTSHFGHGFYRCYYHNMRTGQFYKGIADQEKYAMRHAKKVCVKAARDHEDRARCLFAECLFK